MCDYSLTTVKSRPAKVADRLITRNFGTGTRGFADMEDPTTAVCLLPGTEVAFDEPVAVNVYGITAPSEHKVAIFRQINRDQPRTHHDMLEFPDGKGILLTYMMEGQMATVLQLPAAPRNEQEKQDQRRVEFAG